MMYINLLLTLFPWIWNVEIYITSITQYNDQNKATPTPPAPPVLKLLIFKIFKIFCPPLYLTPFGTYWVGSYIILLTKIY